MPHLGDRVARGFTLIEIAITLAVVALLVGVSVPVIDNVTRADLRAAASKTTGMVKATYDLAALSGKPCRLVFDFKLNTITPEVADSRVLLADPNANGRDEKDDEDKPNLTDQEKLIAMARREVGNTVSVKKTAHWTKAPGTVPFELPSGVKIAEVMAEHMRDAQTEGKATLHFFPMGYCEHAVITFMDESERVYGVEIEPLTGRTRIQDKKIEYKEAK
ncbi:MAG: prepilin-type N-terminal cleavage/methylation domain-containing protein [Deltaproteobacteria bacterium]|nr:prepilin-type N-terminal cleavage/methylation domain-containing protein [Deltaproteobacteria bacterium]